MSKKAEKAFDRVSWPFLYRVLERFGFNNKFIKCIQSLYKEQLTKIKINSRLENLSFSEVHARDAAPVPFLFALFIEPLDQAIRQNEDLKGIDIANEEHVIGLFADDIITYLQNPNTAMLILMSTLDDYNKISGYKVNINKIQILSLKYSASKEIRQVY